MTATEGSHDHDPTENLGIELRVRRRAAELSIAELARRADVSAPFISQVEAGRSSMSIPTLYRVAAAIGCTPNALLSQNSTATSSPPIHVTRAGSGPTMAAGTSEHSQFSRLLTFTGSDALLESYHYVIDPDDDEQEWFEHSGEDFVYVISGAISVEFDDGSAVALNAGDSVHHGGSIRHRWLLVGDAPAEVLCVVAPGS